MRLWNSRGLDDGDSHGYGRAVIFHEADIRDAYDRGRREERDRTRRRSNPFVSVAMFGAALVGGAMLFLAAREGSFSRAGEVADHQLARAQAEAPGVLATATKSATYAVRGVSGSSESSEPDAARSIRVETAP